MTLDTPSANCSVDDWLAWLETIHPKSIELGLDRLALVANRLGLTKPTKPFILVGGTNGKGSTVSMLSKIYTVAGYRVATYTSPHIESFNERICINERPVDNALIIQAFVAIQAELAPQTLTYFEYATLAAMWILERSQCDVYIFEVGLGGRLDATNLWDADVSVLTSIALDHQEYLGDDRAAIATEKVAIGRPGKLLIIGDDDPPETLFDYTKQHQIVTKLVGTLPISSLPNTSLAGAHQRRNAACAIAVIEELSPKLPVDQVQALETLQHLSIPARFEQFQINTISVIADVAHNTAGAEALASTWKEQFGETKAQLMFACLADKDLDGIVHALLPITAQWHCIPLEAYRSYPNGQLAERIKKHSDLPVIDHNSVEDAWTLAISEAIKHHQAILIAGSFYTIAVARKTLQHYIP